MTLFVGIDTSTRIIAGDYYVYQTRLQDMLFWPVTSKGERAQLIEYPIPTEAKTVEVTYRLVDGDGHRWPQKYRVTASRS